MADHNIVGVKGEELAKKHLMEKGYQILETNWRYKRKEIDIIAQIDDIVAIVEVKTRSTDYYGNPEEFVNPQKQRYLIEAADEFIQNLDLELEVRYDIISVILKGEKTKLEHIKDAFVPFLD